MVPKGFSKTKNKQKKTKTLKGSENFTSAKSKSEMSVPAMEPVFYKWTKANLGENLRKAHLVRQGSWKLQKAFYFKNDQEYQI